MKNVKNFLLVLTLVAVVLSFVGCGGNNEEETTEAITTEQTTTEERTTEERTTRNDNDGMIEDTTDDGLVDDVEDMGRSIGEGIEDGVTTVEDMINDMME